MIVACPQCAARYRVDPSRVGPSGARLRCAKCESVFRVASPSQQPAEMATPVSVESPQPMPAAAPKQRPVAASAPEYRFPPEPPSSEFDREKCVLVADSDPESAKRIATALSEWGLAPLVVLDGVEAMLTIQRMLPPVVILDSALTKMFGFQVCEIVKRNESLHSTHVVLMGSIHHADRYRRPPVELYGADVYLEKPDLPDALLSCLRQFGMHVPGGMTESPPPSSIPQPLEQPLEQPPPEEEPSLSFPEPAPPSVPAPIDAPVPTPEPREAPLPPPAPVEAPAAPHFELPEEPELVLAVEAPAPEPAAQSEEPESDGDPRLADQRATAQRLARIIVSDIVLYNPDKFEEAVRAGNVAQALSADLQEGRSLFRQRIDPEVLEERDYLVEELERVAREKGMV